MSQDPILEALLNVTFNALEVALSEEPQVKGVEAEEREKRRERRRKRRKQQGEESLQAFEGRWWRKSVPNSKRWIPYILKYIEHGSLGLNFFDLPLFNGDVTSVVPDSSGLTINLSQTFAGQGSTTQKKIAYPNPKVASICQGKRTNLVGNAWIEIKGNLLFSTKMLEDGTGQISWDGITVGYDGWAFFDTDATLKCIEIGPSEGEVILAGWKNAFTPRLVWN